MFFFLKSPIDLAFWSSQLLSHCWSFYHPFHFIFLVLETCPQIKHFRRKVMKKNLKCEESQVPRLIYFPPFLPFYFPLSFLLPVPPFSTLSFSALPFLICPSPIFFFLVSWILALVSFLFVCLLCFGHGSYVYLFIWNVYISLFCFLFELIVRSFGWELCALLWFDLPAL